MFSYYHHNVDGYDDAKIKNLIYFVASDHKSLSLALASGHNGLNSLTS